MDKEEKKKKKIMIDIINSRNNTRIFFVCLFVKMNVYNL